MVAWGRQLVVGGAILETRVRELRLHESMLSST